MAYLGPMATTSALLAVLDRNATVQLNGRSNNVVIMGWKSETNEYAKNGYKKGTHTYITYTESQLCLAFTPNLSTLLSTFFF